VSHTNAGATTQMTITRRGRVVISTLVASAIVAVGLLFAGPGAQAGAESGSEAPIYTVLAGETLWSIAKELAPSQDPRVTIDQLMRANNLRTAEIRPGDVLRLPSGF
jgi:LysM repeat protein